MQIAAKQKVNRKTKLEAGPNASLELQCRETMERRTKHLGQASKQASRQASRAIHLGTMKPSLHHMN